MPVRLGVVQRVEGCMVPHPGDVLVVDHEASVQFSGRRRLVLRVISVSSKATYEGWGWVTGYVLNESGDATDRREVFVRLAGLRPFTTPTRRDGRRGGDATWSSAQ